MFINLIVSPFSFVFIFPLVSGAWGFQNKTFSLLLEKCHIREHALGGTNFFSIMFFLTNEVIFRRNLSIGLGEVETPFQMHLSDSL